MREKLKPLESTSLSQRSPFPKELKMKRTKKKLGKKGFTTQFRGQKIMVNRVMNIESVTNSIEHVFKQKTW